MATPAFASRYPERSRMEESPENGMTAAWRSIGPSDELTNRPCRRLFAANGKKEDDIALFCYKGNFFAMSAWCSHLGGPLFDGQIEEVPEKGGHVVCPWHGYMFSLESGMTSFGLPQESFKTKIEDGKVFINYHCDLSTEPPK